MITHLSEELWFPDISSATGDGLLAMGGDLSVERLKLAYRSGIFPWYDDGQPIMWWSPDPRMVLFPEKLHVSKSLRRKIAKGRFRVTFNTAFSEVIENCSVIIRKDQAGTWISPEMIAAYSQLHTIGWAGSVEVWEDGNLVGGLYGVDIKEYKVFCGESMFSLISDASKIALFYLRQHLLQKDYKLIDCQMYTDHLSSLGAEEISRESFRSYLTP